MIYQVTEEDLKRLTDDEQQLLRMYEMAIDDATNRTFIIEDMMELMGDDTVFGRMTREIAEKTIDCVERYMETQKEQLIISWLDEHAELGDDK